jgi:hypothetical protein
MFVIDAGGRLKRLRRRPRNWEHLVYEGYHFIPENREWDVDEREAILNCLGLAVADFGTTFLDEEWSAWVRQKADEWCRKGRVSLTA